MESERKDSKKKGFYKKKRVVQPVEMLYQFFVGKQRVHCWLYENKFLRIEGVIKGFDEYMNLVLEEAEEINVKKKTKKMVGRILLKGENISMVQEGTEREKIIAEE